MSTHDLDLKLQQSSCQSGVKASVTCVLSDQERFYTHTDKSRFQNESKQEKFHPGLSAQNIHNKKDLEISTTASSPALPSTGQQQSSKNLQIKQIILLRSKKDFSRTSEEQTKSGRFTSTISISLPIRSRKKDPTEEKTLQGLTDLYNTFEVVKNTDNQHDTELRDVFSPTEKCGKSTGEFFKNEDVPKASFDRERFPSRHQHVLNTPKQGQNTGIQQNLGIHEQAQIIHSSQRHSDTQPVCEVQTEVNQDFGSSDCRENAPTTPQYHSNLTSIGLDSGLKASADSRSFECHTEELNLVLSLASFTAPDSGNTPERTLFNPSSAMLTSALASVLAPPWSGRLRRPKQASNEVEHVPQDCGQNVNPSSLLRQDRQQSLFLPSQRQPSEHMLVNNNEVLLPARTSFNSPDWQKENNSPNVTTGVQPKRPILKSSSVSTMYNNTELHPFSTSMDTHRVQNSGYRISQTEDEHEPFKSFSSKPTTSSLLLSLRRTNFRNSSAEPTQTPMSRSVRPLTFPERIVLKTQSFAQSVTAEDPTAKYPDTPTRTEEIPVSQFPFSPRIENRVPLRTPLFPNKPETEISNTFFRAEEEHVPQSMNKWGQIGLTTQQSSTDIDPVEKTTVNLTTLQNFNITKQKINAHSTISPKDSTSFNVQQSDLNVQNINSQGSQNITARNSSDTSTFTDRLNYSPRKDSPVDGISPTIVGQIYLDSKKHSQSSQSSMDLSSPISPSRPLRSVRVPSIYSYLRESSQAVSTPVPSTSSPHIERDETLPPKEDVGIILGDQKTFHSRFSFDNPILSEFQKSRGSYGSSTHISPAQSLPPDFGRGSAPRLSTSPYSSLISSRPALNNTLQGLSSPPASKTHTTSYDIVTTQADLIKGDPISSPSRYTSITRRSKKQLASPKSEKRTVVQAYTSTLDNHRPAQPCLSQASPDASFVMESQSTNINPHPRQSNAGSNNFPSQEHDGLTALHLDKCNAYPKQRLSEKEKYLLHNKLTEKSETPLSTEKETTAVHIHERLQEIQSPNSKKGLFTSRVKKDNGFSSASLPDKESVSPQYLKTKRHSPEFKTSSRIDQILNRLKLKFGVKRLDSTLDTMPKKKSSTQQHSDTETFEKSKTEEETYSGSQQELSNHSLTTDKNSFCSLSPITLNKSENIINMDLQHRSTTEQKPSGCTWEAPNSSLTTDKEYFASFRSLSPLKLKESENTLNMDWQNRSTTEQKSSGCTWEAPNSNLTTDKMYFASFGSLSPLTLKKSSENKLNVKQQKRHSDETGNQSYSRSFSPHRLKAQSMSRSATLPHYKKSPVSPPSPFYLFDFDSEDIQNDNVFYSPDFSPWSSGKSSVQQNLVRSRLSSSWADLKYGLHNGRSYSVSSVVSSRPSGPGRISTSSDLSSLDEFAQKENYTVDSSVRSSYSPSYEPKSASGKQSQPKYTDDHLDHDDADPTPPPSPTLSSSPRRISQAPTMSSLMRTTSENLSPPRGLLPSRSYTTSLTVFEESSSDTTTDDEYYVDNGDDDEVETEL